MLGDGEIGVILDFMQALAAGAGVYVEIGS